MCNDDRTSTTQSTVLPIIVSTAACRGQQRCNGGQGDGRVVIASALRHFQLAQSGLGDRRLEMAGHRSLKTFSA